MRHMTCLKYILATAMALVIVLPLAAVADENLALYGLKGYTYTYSPIPTDGMHIQTGVMHSRFGSGKLDCREGNIWVAPLSLTFGNGSWWEFAVASHWESWENTDDYWENKNEDTKEDGIGDVFAGMKFRLLNQERGMPLDLSVMPYALIPTGDREKSIGDIYLYNPGDDDDFSYGANLLLGRRWGAFYAAVNLGMNYVDTDVEYIEDKTFFGSLTLEYQFSETMTSYIEFINNENKNRENYPKDCGNPDAYPACKKYPDIAQCYDENTDEDIRELGLGFTYVTGQWGFKLHGGAGLSKTSPDVRGALLINRSFSF